MKHHPNFNKKNIEYYPDKSNIFENNFDLLRFSAAFIVLISHFLGLTSNYHSFGHTRVFKLFENVFSVLAVQIFYCISGFLVSWSAHRTFNSEYSPQTIKIYFKKRLLRILPAYYFYILLYCVILYPITIFLFKNENIFNHLENFFKFIFFNAIFLNFLQNYIINNFTNASDVLNGSLWTINVELCFYLILPIFLLAGKKSKKLMFILIFSISTIYMYLFSPWFIDLITGNSNFATPDLEASRTNLTKYLVRSLSIHTIGQLPYFGMGIFLFTYFKKIKWNFILLSTSLIIFIFSYYNLSLLRSAWAPTSKTFFESSQYILFQFLSAISLSYFLICCSFYKNSITNKFGKYGDFSYGLYIWHYPIIQTLLVIGIISKINIFFSLIIYILITMSISVISWKYIEKPFMDMKKG